MRKIIICLALVLIQCQSIGNGGIPKPAPREATDSEYCTPACEHILTLPGQDGQIGCYEGRPLQLPDGGSESCADYCIDRQKAGRALNPKCWVNVTKCEDVDKLCRNQ